MKEYLTDISKVTTKYQTVIPVRIRAAADLRMSGRLTWHVVRRGARPVIMVSPQPNDWARHLSGLGKEVWEDIDANAYLRQLKEEWQK